MIARGIFILFLFLPSLAFAKMTIVTSITPVASLFAMIAGDKAEVISIASGAGCPHHYSLKPSDLKNVQKADIFVYIDNDFDVFAKALIKKSNAEIIELSKADGLKLAPGNWHIWLLPNNAEAILRLATNALSVKMPDQSNFFENNLALSLKKMQDLELRSLKIIDISNTVLLSDSAEYLFMGREGVQKIYSHGDYASIKSTQDIKSLSEDHSKCFVISSGQSYKKYRSLLGENAHIAQVSAENWVGGGDLANLYYEQYSGILEVLESCSGR